MNTRQRFKMESWKEKWLDGSGWMNGKGWNWIGKNGRM